MRSIVKLMMIALGAGSLLAGCVVAPVGPRGYVGVGVIAPAPVVVVHGYYGGYWHR